ncbi:MAG: hypothetical protein AABY18_07790 [Candidatus Thermoplasmatota archaeon]
MPPTPSTTPGPSKTRAILIGVLGLFALFLLAPTNLASQGDDECGEADSLSNDDTCDEGDCGSSSEVAASTNDEDAECDEDELLICHATGSESNPYVIVPASAAGVYNGHLGLDHQEGEDIIPPFTYQDQPYSQNWDAQGQAIFDAACGIEGDCPDSGEATSSTECTSSTTSTTGTSSSTTTTGTTTTEVPFFTSGTAILLGIGGSLAGTLVMLRRRL